MEMKDKGVNIFIYLFVLIDRNGDFSWLDFEMLQTQIMITCNNFDMKTVVMVSWGEWMIHWVLAGKRVISAFLC